MPAVDDGPATHNGPPSPWSALLRDNLNADEVAGFLSNAIARKEASLLTNAGLAAASPMRGQQALTYGTQPVAARLSDAAARHDARRGPPPSAERVRDRQRRMHGTRDMMAETLDAMSRESSRPGSPELDAVSPGVQTSQRASRDGGVQPTPGGPRTLAQWQGYVLKAQQSEANTREELRRLQSQVDRNSSRHVDELADTQRKCEVSNRCQLARPLFTPLSRPSLSPLSHPIHPLPTSGSARPSRREGYCHTARG